MIMINDDVDHENLIRVRLCACACVHGWEEEGFFLWVGGSGLGGWGVFALPSHKESFFQ